MLKTVFKSGIMTVCVMLCLAVAAVLVLKLYIGYDDDGYTKEAQELILSYQGLSYDAAVSQLDKMHEENKSKLEASADIGSDEYYDRYNYAENLYFKVKNDLAVQRFSEEIILLSNGAERISRLPGERVLSNLSAYSSLPFPSPAEQQSWRRYKKLTDLEPTSVLIFLIILFAYIPEFERGIYNANIITENGKCYYSLKFTVCALLSVFTALFTFACDVLISGIYHSTDIFSHLRSVEFFAESFVDINIFWYLTLSLLFRIMLSVNTLCLLYALAYKLKNMFRFIRVSVILFTVSAVLCMILPDAGSFLPLCFAKLEAQINAALCLNGISLIIPYFAMIIIITAAVFFITKHKFFERNKRHENI